MMSEDVAVADAHSAQWLFDELRDYLWNRDHLQLIASRLGLEKVGSVLDVGCGVGHWTFLLASVLRPDVQVVAVDSELRWVEEAAARAERGGVAERFDFRVGDARELDFPDAAFDLVTCQTLLMHMSDPRATVTELLRVTKPGGFVMFSEPNSLSALLVLSSANAGAPIDEFVELVRFGLTCERGKAALGEGNDSVGNLLPGYLADLGATEIQTFACDKTHGLHPPYASSEQQALRDYFLEGPDTMLWPREKARRFFQAGGGNEEDFEAGWNARLEECARDAAAIIAGTFHSVGGFALYLTAARRAQT
jgi:2-polyprenyl-3-methyl-5-hydroxy-6-metoxy-1,4-benzoquinol methylase